VTQASAVAAGGSGVSFVVGWDDRLVAVISGGLSGVQSVLSSVVSTFVAKNPLVAGLMDEVATVLEAVDLGSNKFLSTSAVIASTTKDVLEKLAQSAVVKEAAVSGGVSVDELMQSLSTEMTRVVRTIDMGGDVTKLVASMEKAVAKILGDTVVSGVNVIGGAVASAVSSGGKGSGKGGADWAVGMSLADIKRMESSVDLWQQVVQMNANLARSKERLLGVTVAEIAELKAGEMTLEQQAEISLQLEATERRMEKVTERRVRGLGGLFDGLFEKMSTAENMLSGILGVQMAGYLSDAHKRLVEMARVASSVSFDVESTRENIALIKEGLSDSRELAQLGVSHNETVAQINKFMSKGIRGTENAIKLAKTGLALDKAMGMEAGKSADILDFWTRSLKFSNREVSAMALSTRMLSKQLGVGGDEMMGMIDASRTILDNMRQMVKVSATTARNVQKTIAYAKKEQLPLMEKIQDSVSTWTAWQSAGEKEKLLVQTALGPDFFEFQKELFRQGTVDIAKWGPIIGSGMEQVANRYGSKSAAMLQEMYGAGKEMIKDSGRGLQISQKTAQENISALNTFAASSTKNIARATATFAAEAPGLMSELSKQGVVDKSAVIDALKKQRLLQPESMGPKIDEMIQTLRKLKPSDRRAQAVKLISTQLQVDGMNRFFDLITKSTSEEKVYLKQLNVAKGADAEVIKAQGTKTVAELVKGFGGMDVIAANVTDLMNQEGTAGENIRKYFTDMGILQKGQTAVALDMPKNFAELGVLVDAMSKGMEIAEATQQSQADRATKLQEDMLTGINAVQNAAEMLVNSFITSFSPQLFEILGRIVEWLPLIAGAGAGLLVGSKILKVAFGLGKTVVGGIAGAVKGVGGLLGRGAAGEGATAVAGAAGEGATGAVGAASKGVMATAKSAVKIAAMVGIVAGAAEGAYGAWNNAGALLDKAEVDTADKLNALGAGMLTGVANMFTMGKFDDILGPNGSATKGLAKAFESGSNWLAEVAVEHMSSLFPKADREMLEQSRESEKVMEKRGGAAQRISAEKMKIFHAKIRGEGIGSATSLEEAVRMYMERGGTDETTAINALHNLSKKRANQIDEMRKKGTAVLDSTAIPAALTGVTNAATEVAKAATEAATAEGKALNNLASKISDKGKEVEKSVTKAALAVALANAQPPPPPPPLPPQPQLLPVPPPPPEPGSFEEKASHAALNRTKRAKAWQEGALSSDLIKERNKRFEASRVALLISETEAKRKRELAIMSKHEKINAGNEFALQEAAAMRKDINRVADTKIAELRGTVVEPPSVALGGRIVRSGLAVVHSGEDVVNRAAVVEKGGEFTYNKTAFELVERVNKLIVPLERISSSAIWDVDSSFAEIVQERLAKVLEQFATSFADVHHQVEVVPPIEPDVISVAPGVGESQLSKSFAESASLLTSINSNNQRQNELAEQQLSELKNISSILGSGRGRGVGGGGGEVAGGGRRTAVLAPRDVRRAITNDTANSLLWINTDATTAAMTSGLHTRDAG